MFNFFDQCNFNRYRSMVFLLARLIVAVIIFKAGYNKLPVSEVGGLVAKLPEWLRYMVVLFELIGPIFLLLGIRNERFNILGSLMIAIVMLGATYMKVAVAGNAFLSSGAMYPFSLLIIALILLTDE
jgi:uncharacterized membrane protein YphA (DoxX/SURF4 family)